jgi:hypothetical protein
MPPIAAVSENPSCSVISENEAEERKRKKRSASHLHRRKRSGKSGKSASFFSLRPVSHADFSFLSLFCVLA